MRCLHEAQEFAPGDNRHDGEQADTHAEQGFEMLSRKMNEKPAQAAAGADSPVVAAKSVSVRTAM